MSPSPPPSGPGGASSSSQIANLLSRALADCENLRQQLDAANRRTQKAERLLAAVSSGSGGPFSPTTPSKPSSSHVNAILDAEARAEKAEKHRDELELRLHALAEAWTEIERYLSVVDVRAADARSMFGRCFSELGRGELVLHPVPAFPGFPGQPGAQSQLAIMQQQQQQVQQAQQMQLLTHQHRRHHRTSSRVSSGGMPHIPGPPAGAPHGQHMPIPPQPHGHMPPHLHGPPNQQGYPAAPGGVPIPMHASSFPQLPPAPTTAPTHSAGSRQPPRFNGSPGPESHPANRMRRPASPLDSSGPDVRAAKRAKSEKDPRDREHRAERARFSDSPQMSPQLPPSSAHPGTINDLNAQSAPNSPTRPSSSQPQNHQYHSPPTDQPTPHNANSTNPHRPSIQTTRVTPHSGGAPQTPVGPPDQARPHPSQGAPGLHRPNGSSSVVTGATRFNAGQHPRPDNPDDEEDELLDDAMYSSHSAHAAPRKGLEPGASRDFEDDDADKDEMSIDDMILTAASGTDPSRSRHDHNRSRRTPSSSSSERSGYGPTHPYQQQVTIPHRVSPSTQMDPGNPAFRQLGPGGPRQQPLTASRQNTMHMGPGMPPLGGHIPGHGTGGGGKRALPQGSLNALGQRTCRQCGMPGRYKDGKCVEKWGPGPEGPGTVCDRCRKKMKRVERRGTVESMSMSSYGGSQFIPQHPSSNSSSALDPESAYHRHRISPTYVERDRYAPSQGYHTQETQATQIQSQPHPHAHPGQGLTYVLPSPAVGPGPGVPKWETSNGRHDSRDFSRSPTASPARELDQHAADRVDRHPKPQPNGSAAQQRYPNGSRRSTPEAEGGESQTTVLPPTTRLPPVPSLSGSASKGLVPVTSTEMSHTNGNSNGSRHSVQPRKEARGLNEDRGTPETEGHADGDHSMDEGDRAGARNSDLEAPRSSAEDQGVKTEEAVAVTA